MMARDSPSASVRLTSRSTESSPLRVGYVLDRFWTVRLIGGSLSSPRMSAAVPWGLALKTPQESLRSSWDLLDLSILQFQERKFQTSLNFLHERFAVRHHRARHL